MGAYLSSPITENISDDNSTEKYSYGASSMQGWRVSQEVRASSHFLWFLSFDRALKFTIKKDNAGVNSRSVFYQMKIDTTE